MATQIVELTGDEAKLLKSIQSVIQKQMEYERKLQSTGEEGKKAGDEIGGAFEKAGDRAAREMNQLLRELRSLGPEGRESATALKRHLQEAGQAGHRSMDKVLSAIREIDPEAAEAAHEAKAAFEAAAHQSGAEFRKVLQELDKMGPAGRDAAKQIEKELVAAGKIGKRSMRDIVEELHKIDPAAGRVGTKVLTEMRTATTGGATAFRSFGTVALAQMGAVGASVIGIQEVISSITQSVEHQVELLERAKQAQIGLAGAQQEAAKNLAGVSEDERTALLTTDLIDVVGNTKFADVQAIQLAFGQVASAGAGTRAEIKNAVESAAPLNRQSPEQLGDAAAAGFVVTKGAGLDDTRQGISLLQTLATQARIEEFSLLTKNAPQGLLATTATVPNQNPVDALEEAGAFFAAVTQIGNDTTGQSSRTFQTMFSTKLEGFLGNLEGEQRDARSRIEVLSRKVDSGKATESDRFEIEQLNAFLKDSADITKIPEGFMDRVTLLQNNPEVARQFKGDGFGEQQFRTFLNQIFIPGSAADRRFRSSREIVSADLSTYEREAEFQKFGTPQLAQQYARDQAEAAKVLRDLRDREGAVLSQVREIAGSALSDTSHGWGSQWFGTPWWIQSGGLTGSTAAEEARSADAAMSRRIFLLRHSGEVSEQDRIDIALLEEARESIRDLIASQEATQERIAIALENIEANTAVTADAAERPHEPESPSVTPELSATVP